MNALREAHIQHEVHSAWPQSGNTPKNALREAHPQCEAHAAWPQSGNPSEQSVTTAAVYIGVDVAKASLALNFPGLSDEYPNTIKGHQAIIKKLPKAAHIVMECSARSAYQNAKRTPHSREAAIHRRLSARLCAHAASPGRGGERGQRAPGAQLRPSHGAIAALRPCEVRFAVEYALRAEHWPRAMPLMPMSSPALLKASSPHPTGS